MLEYYEIIFNIKYLKYYLICKYIENNSIYNRGGGYILLRDERKNADVVTRLYHARAHENARTRAYVRSSLPGFPSTLLTTLYTLLMVCRWQSV